MIGRIIIALLMIAAAAIVTMERETAVVADMTAELAESKYADAEERAKKYEARAKDAENKLTEIEAKNQWLEGEIAEAKRLRELSLLPLEVKMLHPTMKGALDAAELMRVVQRERMDSNACFARAPMRGPQVTLRWVVRLDGTVNNVSAASVPPGFDDVVECLRAEVSSWRFAPTKLGLSLAQVTWDTTSPSAAAAP